MEKKRKKIEGEKIADYRLLFSTQQLNIVKSLKTFSTTLYSIVASIQLVRHVMSELAHERARPKRVASLAASAPTSAYSTTTMQFSPSL